MFSYSSSNNNRNCCICRFFCHSQKSSSCGSVTALFLVASVFPVRIYIPFTFMYLKFCITHLSLHLVLNASLIFCLLSLNVIFFHYNVHLKLSSLAVLNTDPCWPNNSVLFDRRRFYCGRLQPNHWAVPATQSLPPNTAVRSQAQPLKTSARLSRVCLLIRAEQLLVYLTVLRLNLRIAAWQTNQWKLQA